MALTNLSELRSFLQKIGAAPKKSLSQNFLIDGNIKRKILRLAEVEKNDLILEIGAGPGALTEDFINTGAQVIAIEKDRQFAQALKRFHSLQVFEGDVLSYPFETLEAGFKVVANLPYHLTTPIISLLVPQYKIFKNITVMVQEEVARRMVAKSGSAEYSSLTVFLNYYADINYGFFVSRNCFYPSPNVDSAVVQLTLKPPPSLDALAFFKFVRTAFGMRRKMIKTSLGKEYGGSKKIEQALVQLNLNPETRPEALNLEELISLFIKIEH